MLLRDFASCKENIDDIKNISEKRRYIIVFKYDSPIHYCMSMAIDNNSGAYDLYLINESTVHGNNFMVPYGITLMQRNQYRGSARNLLTPDGKLNMNSEIMFYYGSYANRIHKNDGEVWRLSLPTLLETCGGLGANSMEEEALRLLNTDWLQPYPNFYNIEDQAHFSKANPNTFVGDFTYDRMQLPTYKLGDLFDQYTKVAIVEMPNINKLFDMRLANPMYEECSFVRDDYYMGSTDPNIKFNNGMSLNLESYKGLISSLFMKTYQFLFDSVFCQLDMIVDTDYGTFNIDQNSLRLKFREVTKEQIRDDYKLLLERLSTTIQYLFEEFDVDTEMYAEGLVPNRIMIHISNTGCNIRVSNTRKIIGSNKGRPIYMSSSSKSSSADVDECVTTECSEGSY